MHQIEKIIGDYQRFFSNLLSRLNTLNINIVKKPLSHILYRTTTFAEYEKLRDELKRHCREFVETQFNSRPISILILKEPLLLADNFTVSTIELPAPRHDEKYASGLQSLGVVMAEHWAQFVQQYRALLMGIKEQEHNQSASIAFDDGQAVKFYSMPLREVVLAEGFQFEKNKECL